MELRHKVRIGGGGFSLIEMLVALGVSAVIMMAVATMISNQGQAIKTVEMKQERTDFNLYLKTVLMVPAQCFNALKGLSGIPTPALISSGISASTTVPKEFEIPLSSAQINFLDQPLNAYPLRFFDKFDVPTGSKVLFRARSVVGSTVSGLMEITLKSSDGMMALKKERFPFSMTLDPATGALVSCPGGGFGGSNSNARCGYHLGGGGARTMAPVDATICYLSSFGTDQSSSGHSYCHADPDLSVPNKWTLQMSGNKGWIRCYWICTNAMDPLPAGCTRL